MKYWEWAPTFELAPKQIALLIIDMQNGFIEPGAPLEVPMARSQIPTIQRLLRFFRAQNLPVLFTAVCVTPRHPLSLLLEYGETALFTARITRRHILCQITIKPNYLASSTTQGRTRDHE